MEKVHQHRVGSSGCSVANMDVFHQDLDVICQSRGLVIIMDVLHLDLDVRCQS